MKRFLKIFAISLSVLISLFVIGLVAAYLALRSPSFMAKFIPKMEQLAEEKAGVKIAIGSLSFDLFRHLVLENIKTHLQKDTLTTDVVLEKVALHYGLWNLIWHRNLVVSEVLVEGVRIDVKIDGLPPTEPEKAEKESSSGNPLDLLKNPPARVNLDSLEVKGLQVNLAFTDKGKSVNAQINPINIASKLALNPAKLVLSYDLGLRTADWIPIQVQIDDATAKSSLTLALMFEIASKGNLAIEAKENAFKFDLEKFANSASISNAVVSLVDPSQDIKLEFGGLKALGEAKISAELASFDQLFERLKAQFDGRLKVDSLALEAQKAQTKQRVSFAEEDVKFKGEMEGSQLVLNLDQHLRQLFVNPLKEPLDLQLGVNTKVEGLGALLKKGEGGLKTPATVTANIQLSHVAAPPLQAPANIDVKVEAAVEDLNGIAKRVGSVKTDLSMNASNIVMAPFKVPLNVATKVNFSSKLQDHSYDLAGDLKLNDIDTVKYQLSLSDQPKTLDLSGSINAVASSELATLMDSLKALNKIGSLSLANNLKVSLTHPWESIEKAEGDIPSVISADVDLQTTVVQQASPTDPDMDLMLPKPMTVKHQVQWSKSSAKLSVKGQMPKLNVQMRNTKNRPDSPFLKAGVDNLKINLAANVASGLKPRDGSISLKVTADSYTTNLLKDQKDLLQLTDKFAFEFAAVLNNERFVTIKEMKLGTGNDAIQLKLDGKGDIKSKSGQSDGSFVVDLLKLPLLKDLGDRKGTVGVTWDLTALEANRFALSGTAELKDVNIIRDDIKLLGANGAVNLSEELKLAEDKTLAFTHLVDEDPFVRIDFARISPYLLQKNELEIKKIQFKDLSVGPLVATVNVEQNMIIVPNFELALFGGNLAGQFAMNVHPKMTRIGLKGMLTRFDPSQLITHGKAAKDKDRYKGTLSGSTALEIDLNHSLIEGRINVTEISGDQLIQLINFIDPDYEDERLATLRTALHVGYPEYVEINMKYGLMDMRVDVNTLGVSSTENVRGIELTRFVTAYTEPLKKALAKVPIR